MIDCTETHSSVAREPGYEEDSKKHKSNKINKEWDVNNLVLLKAQHWNPQKKNTPQCYSGKASSEKRWKKPCTRQPVSQCMQIIAEE